MIKRISLVVIILIVVTIAAVPLCAASKNTQKLKSAPNFTTKNIMTDKTITLSKYRGKVTLVNFWATWCPPCRAEIPSLNKLYEHYDGKLAIIAISVDRADDAKVIEFAHENDMLFDIAHDTNDIVRAYKIDPIPATFIIDKNGHIVKKIIGSVDWNSQDTYDFFDALIDASESAAVVKKK